MREARIGLGVLSASLLCAAAVVQEPDLAAEVADLCEIVEVPAMGAMVLRAGGEPEIAVAGVRRLDGEAAAEAGDVWHWGSVTKSMTATLVARLVEKEEVRWEDTIAQHLGEAVPDMREAYGDVDFVHLLSHRGGLQPNIPTELFSKFGQDPEDPVGDRLEYVRLALSQEPAGPKEETFLYSNNGFIVAGAMLEAATGESWEALMRREVFAPLGIESGGFGAPPDDGLRGHVTRRGERIAVPPNSDNPAALGPAGRVHMSLADMAKYLDAHMRERDDFLPKESYAKLHTAPFEGNYALGWIAPDENSCWHNGSNTMWYAEVSFDRARGVCAAVAVNDGDLGRVAPEVREFLGGLMGE